jgi:hypothetical protein
MKSNELTISKPVAVLNREIKAEPGKLIKGIGKMLLKGASLDWSGVGEAALDTVDAAGLREKPEELAYLLIYRSLTAALFELVKDHRDLFFNRPEEAELDKISACFEEEMGKAEVRISLDFFKQPGALPLLKQLHGPLSAWLHGLGAKQTDAGQIACRLPDYFVTALHETWRDAPLDYAALTQHFHTPFTQATEEAQNWRRYKQWLQRQVSDRMFAEAFGVEKVYVPLRAYYEEKAAKDGGRQDELREDQGGKKIVVDLESEFRSWLDNFTTDLAVRFISGGPGSGKSTFAKIFAARIAKEKDISVLYIPLHRFNAKEDLIIAMESHIRNNPFLTDNPLDAKTGKDRLLIIFDGLDELALQGKAASEMANNFVDEVLRRIHAGNSQGCKRQVIITGRTIAIQTVAAKLREAKQITHVLPYFVAEEEREEYEDPANLLEHDQRQDWWQKYGAAAGKGYAGLPDELARQSFLEISAQPLLNYLLALSYDRKAITFSDDTTLNQIYADLIKAVYHRQYADCGQGRACVSELDEEQFVRVLEEIAVAVWHGDGRTATVASIREKFKSGGIARYLELFQEGAKAGVTRLLTAFYFRQSENRKDGDPTFEFTHKSFGEYLTALRIVRLLRQMEKQCRRQQEDPDDGWSEKETLQHWTSFCAVTGMDKDLLRFISNEFRAMTQAELLALQGIVRELLSYTINQGLPFPDEFKGKGFKEHLRLAGNAEISLMAVHFHIAEMTKQVSRLELEHGTAFGEWFRRVNGPWGCAGWLGYLDLSGYHLNMQNFLNGNFAMSRLESTRSHTSIFAGANFKGAQLAKAYLLGANLRNTNLEGANLKDAYLPWADLRNAKLEGANLEGANLREAILTDTILDKKEA